MTILTSREDRKRRVIRSAMLKAEKMVKNYFRRNLECPRETYERYRRVTSTTYICKRFNIDEDVLKRLMADDAVTERELEAERTATTPTSKKSQQRPVVIPPSVETLKLRVKDKPDRPPRPKRTVPITKREIILKRRISAFLSRGADPTPFTVEDVITKFGPTPKCALSGRNINYDDGTTYHFDHIIPVKRGGSATLNNLQLISPTVNGIKCAMTDSEYIKLCREVVAYQDSLTART